MTITVKKAFLCLAVFAGTLVLTNAALAQVTIPNPLSSNSFSELLTKIAEAVGILIASLGSIMLIISGILFLISAGDPQRIATAKKALFYAIIGIMIGVAASTIASVILEIIGAPTTSLPTYP